MHGLTLIAAAVATLFSSPAPPARQYQSPEAASLFAQIDAESARSLAQARALSAATKLNVLQTAVSSIKPRYRYVWCFNGHVYVRRIYVGR